MKKFAVFSGFLGSGKTTTMMKLTKYYSEKYADAAMISNDLGHGVILADNRFAQLAGCHASDMTEDCICYRNEDLAERLQTYYQNGFELVVSDIPGFGVGALEHVYHGLTEKFPGQFELAPFTVLTEPQTIRALRDGCGPDLEYLYNTQLTEGDLIVLNKCDLLTETEKEEALAWLRSRYPQAVCIGISAEDGTGIDELAKLLREGKASMRRPDIGYGGPVFMQAMGSIWEYYYQFAAVVCCNTFDGNAYLRDIAEKILAAIPEEGADIPHLKLLAWNVEGDYGRVDLIGRDREIECNHSFAEPCTQIAVVINGSGVGEKEKMEAVLTEEVDRVSAEYQLEISMTKRECFGMGE
ncbi:MAG: GTP-binding protein [Eubacteriales bacterium]|nr:GTP-binding protein [Eubacteriales bacterium]